MLKIKVDNIDVNIVVTKIMKLMALMKLTNVNDGGESVE